jgi:two-component system OmpR family sensor kinase
MTRSRRLSLRARMLVLLIGVTVIFLLVMGTVSAAFLDGNLHAQFDHNLIVATQNAESLSKINSGYAAAEVTFSPYQVVPLSSSSTATTALVNNVKQLGPGYVFRHRGTLFNVPAAGNLPELRGFSRAVPGALHPGHRGVVLIVVARPVNVLVSQVRGFIIALLVTAAALIGLLAIGGEWLIGRGLDPLEKMTVTANEITSRGDLTARMPHASDETEVGSLGSAINTMLDRIQLAFGARHRSEQRVREFAADASHELRTPLTTIRGYAELYRQGALGPDQLPNAMRRIEQEAQRMSTLVAELLELARLDRISSLDLAETDLAGVVRDAVADAVAVEPKRPVRAEAPPRLVAVVDERRIRQVLANLLGNVRAHTPVTTPAAVRLGQVTGGILIEVADAGPGMSSEDAARAFDRFHRASERPGTDPGEDARRSDSADQLQVGPASHGYRNGAGPASHETSHGYRNSASPASHETSHGYRNSASPASHETRQRHSNGIEPASHGTGTGYSNGIGLAGHDTGRGHGTSGSPADGRDRGSKERAAGGGSGLGLSIVQAIAAAHGGQATLESWPGRGTRVRIWLPDRTSPPAPDPDPPG